uniref:Alternative protein F7 n=1 Tax=Homo sapiens TaxID=9606 RepID=L8EC53_HUMAN|nr:alternative protein F7 [Homo sapiens]
MGTSVPQVHARMGAPARTSSSPISASASLPSRAGTVRRTRMTS